MTPHTQLNRHDPLMGVYGDCFRTCIASVLDLHPAEVPHVFDKHHDDGDAAMAKMNEWLGGRGLRAIWIAYQGDTPRSRLLSILGDMNPGLPFLLGGQSRPGVGHFVVCMDGEIVSDPSPTPTGDLAPHDDGLWHVYFIGKAV